MTLLGRFLLTFLKVVTFAVVAGAVVAFMITGGGLDLGPLAGPADGPTDGDSTAGPAAGGTADTTTPADRPRGRSPWGEEVLVVAVENTADPWRNVTAAVEAALAYWESNIGYADYTARFRLRPDADDPDVIVWYNRSIECAHHGDAIGCAPLLEATESVDRPVHVEVRYDRNDNRRQVRNTAIHELGHVLGVTHCEEPYWVMASACTEPIPDAPDAANRSLAWREAELSVYVDDTNVSAGEREATADQVQHALDYFENASGDEFPAEVTIDRVDDPFDADVTIVFAAEPACPDDMVVCYSQWGRDYDRDGRIEYFTNGRIRVVTDTDVDARGWYVGSALARQLSPGNVPAVFRDASHRERRSRWWE